MTGPEFADAIGVALGMKEVTSDTVPTLDQVIVLINIAAQEVAKENADKMHTLLVKETQAESPHGEVFKIVAVKIGNYNAQEVSLTEFFDKKESQRSEKPFWAYNEPDAGVVIQLYTGTDYDIWYIEEPLYEASPSAEKPLPAEWDEEILKRAIAYAKSGEGEAGFLGLLMQKDPDLVLRGGE